MTRSFALDAVQAARWAIQPEWLKVIGDIAQRHNLDPRALEQKLGRPLDNTQLATERDGVATIPITGPIFPKANLMTALSGATSLDLLARDFTAAVNNDDVGAIILNIESPGGVALGIAEAAEMIAAAREVKPVVAYVGGLAASAAYWLASAAGEIVLHQSAMVGSIGVVTAVPVQENPDRDGYRAIEVVSSNAPAKRPDPRTDDGLAEIRGELDALEAIFIDQVAANRGVTADDVVARFGKGGVKIGIAAINAGMADRLGRYEALQAELAARIAADEIRPGVAAPTAKHSNAAPATRHQHDEADEMSLENLTAEQLEADRPDLVAAIRKDAASKAAAAAAEEGDAAGYERGLAAGAEAERARILAIQELAEPGYEALIADCIADGGCSAEQAAHRLVGKQRADRTKQLDDLRADDPPAPDPQPAAPGGADVPAIAKDPRGLARAAGRLIEAAQQRGETLGPDEAVSLVLQGETAA